MLNFPNAEDNDGIHIEKIVGAVPCPKHGKDIGDACWNLPSVNGILKAICNDRALSAGANGDITPYNVAPITRTNPRKKEFTR